MGTRALDREAKDSRDDDAEGINHTSEDVAEGLKRLAETIQRVKGSHRDLNVDNRLCGRAWDRGRADMVDAESDSAECPPQSLSPVLEQARP